jgi:hypothetical protein
MHENGKDRTTVNHGVPTYDPHVKVRLFNPDFPQSSRTNNETQLRLGCNLTYRFQDGVGELDDPSRNEGTAGTTMASSQVSQVKQEGARQGGWS